MSWLGYARCYIAKTKTKTSQSGSPIFKKRGKGKAPFSRFFWAHLKA
jgi:hypothetical protein